MERRCYRGIVGAEVECTSRDSRDRASKFFPFGRMCKFLAFDTIFLSGEGERGAGSATKTIERHEERISKVLTTNFELSVFEAEGMLSIPGGFALFFGAQEKIKYHPYAIHGGSITKVGGLLDQGFGLKENGHWDRFYSSRRIIFLVLRVVHSPKTKIMFPG